MNSLQDLEQFYIDRDGIYIGDTAAQEKQVAAIVTYERNRRDSSLPAADEIRPGDIQVALRKMGYHYNGSEWVMS